MLLLFGCVANLPILMLAVVAIICASLVAFNLTDATCILMYFSPLSYILVYNQYNIYILIAVAYMAVTLIKKRYAVGVITLVFLLFYCVCFANFDAPLNIGQFIYPMLLMLLIFVCQNAKKKDYKRYVDYFLAGFIISAIIGFFKDQIPLIQNILDSDILYIDGVETSMNIIRYSGLSYDPNFFALIDCILIAVLLVSETRMNFIKLMTICFLVVVGLFTFSKSYVILLGIIVIIFALKNKKMLKTMFIVLIGGSCLLLAEKYSNLSLLSLIEARFSSANGVNDLTTGRTEIWTEYIRYIFGNAKCLFWGDGFNTFSLRKAAHNTYIDFIYRFGIVGTILWWRYFALSNSYIKKVNGKKTLLNVPGLVLLLGVFFLSAFHFQQFWCCIFLVMISPYLNVEENG